MAIIGSEGSEGISNIIVGGPNGDRVSHRFVAEQTDQIESYKYYRITSPTNTGYSKGTGGNIRITIYDDNNGLPGNPLPASGGANTSNFPSSWFGPHVIAGTAYHAVFENIDPAPVDNYASVDNLWRSVKTEIPLGTATVLFQPAGTPWRTYVNQTPIYQINYANGAKQGFGYMEVWIKTSLKPFDNALHLVRQIFTPTRSFAATTGGVRVHSATMPLTIWLGTRILATIPAPVPVDRWLPFNISPGYQLTSGLPCVFSLGGNGTVFPIRKGSYYGFDKSLYLDGHAEWSANGGLIWNPWPDESGRPSIEGDLQFFLKG